jgi:hypothetical protein
LHYDPTEFSRRLRLSHLNKQIDDTHTYNCTYTFIYVFVRDRHAFQLTRRVSAETSLTIYLYIVATTFLTNYYRIIITTIHSFGAYFLLYPS